jgi:hypothetical protein|tara:strand:- start:1301 stop:1762 length:462 start_codon:yes stop_codon:yes gene_type:complete
MEDTFNLKQWKSDITLNENIGDRLKQSSMDDLFQSVRNLAHVTEMGIDEAAITAINAIGVEFGVDDMLSEDIDDDTAEKAPAGDKALNKRLSKADKIVKDYKRLRDLMKTELDMYKSFESPENKELAKNRLKKLTPEFQAAKKAYEKLKGVKL